MYLPTASIFPFLIDIDPLLIKFHGEVWIIAFVRVHTLGEFSRRCSTGSVCENNSVESIIIRLFFIFKNLDL